MSEIRTLRCQCQYERGLVYLPSLGRPDNFEGLILRLFPACLAYLSVSGCGLAVLLLARGASRE